MEFRRSLSNFEMCRTCLGQRNESVHLFDIDTPESTAEELTIGQKLSQCVPELNLSMTPSAVICTNCLSAINFIIDFKKVCIQSERDIQKTGSAAVNQTDLVKVDAPIKQDPEKIEIKYEVFNDEVCDHKTSLKSTEHEEKNFEFIDIKDEVEESKPDIQCSLPDTQEREGEEDNVFICNDCGEQASSKAELIVHVKVHVKQTKKGATDVKAGCQQKTYKCRMCNYQTDSQRRLLAHRIVHIKSKVFKCSVCEYLCAHQGHLNQHMRIHTGVKPYKCTFCAYCTGRREALTIHMRRHTGEKPYQCTHCPYTCIKQDVLKAHMSNHGISAPYVCKECSFGCKKEYLLTRHMIVHKKPAASTKEDGQEMTS